MLLNYLKLSLRLLVRNPFFTFINVLGLSVGFAAFFALWQYASTQLQTDRYHPNYERIARLGMDWRFTDDGKSWTFVKCGFFHPETTYRINADFPEVEDYVRILFQPQFSKLLVGHGKHLVLSAEKSDGSKAIFNEEKIVYADHNLFEFFSIPLVHGEKKNALRDPNSIVLSGSMARKYFGKENPSGKLLILNGSISLKVTGVFQDFPDNTHLDFDCVISNASRINDWNTSSWFGPISYVRLKRGILLSDFEKSINKQTQKYWAKLFSDRPNVKADMFVQPLDEVAFSNNYLADYFTSKSKPLLITFSVVSVVILLMAWINFVNLTLARTAKRMREVATRKTAGAGSRDFVKQFLVESLLTNMIALALACTLLQVARGPAEIILHLPTPGWNASSPSSIWFLVLVVVVGVIITGLYPALMAMKYNPRKLLSFGSTPRSNLFQGVLTTFQYASATVLLLWVFVIYFQLSFLFKKGFGASADSIAVIESPIVKPENFSQVMAYFQNRLSALSLVEDAVPANSIDLSGYFFLKKSASSIPVGSASHGGVNEKFIPFFGVTLLAGRNFQSLDRANVIIISRESVARLGFDSITEAVGSKVWISRDNDDTGAITNGVEVEIIGIIDDYRTEASYSFAGTNSRRNGANGICLTYKDYLFSDITPDRLAVKLDINKLDEVLPQIEEVFKEVFPDSAFILYFQDDHIEKNYQSEKTSRNQLVFFSLLAIGISCLGLLGMISNKVMDKIKEIGIRKILGARLYQIAQILLNTTVKQIMVATVIGIPIAYYLTELYLEKFSERITLSWWHFALPVIILMFIMLATIASVLWKAARSNPVEALKYE